MIEAGSGVHVLVRAGSLVGEISGLPLCATAAAEAETWLKGWIIEHIRIEDSKYSGFLNSKNIF